jgi:hypothetical protein
MRLFSSKKWELLADFAIMAAFGLFAISPLLSPGYFTKAHDAHHSVFFLVQMDQNIREGVLWPRWGPDHALGYGYPLWLLYAPLAYYAAEAFHLLGLGFTNSVKAGWLLFTLIGMFGAYLLVLRWWRNRWGAIVAGLVYVYVPYHLVDIYVRAAYSEYAAAAWFPWVLLAFYELVDRKSLRSAGLAALAYGALMLTHSGTIILFTPILAVWVGFWLVASWYRERRFPIRGTVYSLFAGVLAIGIAGVFLIPAVIEKKYILESQWVAGSYNYRMHFTYLFQLFEPFCGFGYSVPGPKDGMPLQLGLIPFLLSAVACCFALRSEVENRKEILFAGAMLAVTAFMMLPASEPVWKSVPAFSLIQFPWRLLGISAILMTVMAGGMLPSLKVDAPWAGVLVASLVVLGSIGYVTPRLTDISKVDESPGGPTAFELRYPDMIGMTIWTRVQPKDSPMVPYYQGKVEQIVKAHILEGRGKVRQLFHGGSTDVVEVDAKTPVVLQFYTYYFPGWQATVDGAPAAIRPEGDFGLITLDVPQGRHVVRVHIGGFSTPARKAGGAATLLSLVILLASLFFGKRRVHRT